MDDTRFCYFSLVGSAGAYWSLLNYSEVLATLLPMRVLTGDLCFAFVPCQYRESCLRAKHSHDPLTAFR